MYADSGLLCPYFQSFSPDFQQLEEYCKFQKINVSSSVLDPLSTISEYDWETELDILKTPAPCLEEHDLNLAPMSLTSCGDQEIDVGDIGNGDDLFGDAFYDVNGAVNPPFAEALPLFDGYANAIQEDKGASLKPNFLDFPSIDFGFGMRRAYSEGDIKTLNNANVNYSSSRPEKPQLVSSCSSEDRKEKLSRYKSKKSKRNFDRKIKKGARRQPAEDPGEVCEDRRIGALNAAEA